MTQDEHTDNQMPMTSAVVVAVVLLLAVVGAVLWFTRDGQTDPPPTAAPTTEPGTSPSTADTEPPTPPPASSVPGPSEVIPGWSTVEVAGTSLPVSTEAGPHDLSNGRARDFERTELGAVMAAVHLLARASGYATPAVYEPTIAEQVVEGEDQQRLLSAVQAAYDEGVREQGREDPLNAGMIRGYRVEEYSDDAAAVEVWTEAAGPSGRVRVGATVELKWFDAVGWKLVPPLNGDWGPQVRELVLTNEFTEFPPEVR